MKHIMLCKSTAASVLALTLGATSVHAQTAGPPSSPSSQTPDDATAAEPAAGVGADVIVTARKRGERLIDVPISLQAFSEAEIKSSGIDDLQTLKDRAGFQFPPQVSNGPAGRFTGTLIFRGLQANSFGEPRDSSGALFVDGIFISGGLQSINTADVERIEVLKGPQNAYFGRSTFGGAVNFITRNPSNTFGGEINVRGTARGTVDADASIEGPIVSDVLTARVTATTHNKVAQYRAADGGELGAEETQSLAATLYFTPTKNFWLRLRGLVQRDDDSAPSFGFISANAQAQGCIGQRVPGFNQRTGAPVTLNREYFCRSGVPDLDDVRAFVNPAAAAGATYLAGSSVVTANTAVPAFVRDALRTRRVLLNGVSTPGRFWVGTPNLDHAGMIRDSVRLSAQSALTFDSGASLAVNVGYNQQDSMAFNDVDKTDLASFGSIVAFRTKDLTLDARFTSDPAKRIRLLLGASYFYGKSQFSQGDPNFGPQTVTQGAITDDRANVPAFYGSIDFDLLKNLTLTAEGRYQEDKITTFNTAGAKFEQTFKDFLPRVIVSFKPQPNWNIYASYSKGVQPARLQTGFASLANPPLSFPNEALTYVRGVFPGIGLFSPLPKLTAYEVGMKQSLLDGRLSYGIAAYQNDWKNALVSSAIFNPNACLITTPQVFNTAACPLLAAGIFVSQPNDARIRGVEFQADAQVTREWSIDGTIDFKDARWKRYANTGLNAFTGLNNALGDVYRGDGNYLGRVPRWSGTLATTYRGQFGGDWGWYARADALYTGKAWDSDVNAFQTDAYVRVNARVGFTHDDLTIELFSTNLFNDDTYDGIANTVELAGNFSQRAAAVIPAQKREFGLRLQYKF